MKVVEAIKVGLAADDKYEQVVRDKALETLAIFANQQLDIEAKQEAQAIYDKLVDTPRVLGALCEILCPVGNQRRS